MPRTTMIVADHGAGVVELARLLTETDLRTPELRIPRVGPVLGMKRDNSQVRLSPTGYPLH